MRLLGVAHPSAVEGVGNKEEGHHEDDKPGYFILDRVATVQFLLPSLGVKDIQVLHEDG